MKDYTREICSEFIARYPDSAAYRGGRKLRLGGWESRYPETIKSLEAKNAFLESAEELCDRGILSAAWKRFREGDVIEALYLENPDKLYSYAGLPHPDQVRRMFLAAVEAFEPVSDLSGQLKAGLIGILSEKKEPVTAETEEITDILRLADVPPEEINRATIRELSTRIFHNSKRIEQILPRADRIAASVRGEPLSETLNLGRSYPETSFCLRGKLTFTDGTSWELAGRSVTLPFATVETVRGFSLPGDPPTVLLLENKESYYTAVNRLRDEDTVSGFSGFLYLGGYPNRAAGRIIRLMETAGARLSCFCDLDPAGLLIAEKVRELLESPPGLWKMDVETFEAYKQYGYPLSGGELNKLNLLKDYRLFPLKTAMEETKLGIEQEIIRV